MNKTYLIIFGPPGSGKGTQADLLSQKMNLPVITPGELLRHEVEIGSELGKQVKQVVDSGELVKDEIIEELVETRLKQPDAKAGAIFDGYPRRQEQLDYLVGRLEREIDSNDKVIAILVEVSDEEVKKRLSSRRMCDCGTAYHLKFNPPKQDEICDQCGKKLYIRKDDKPEVISDRLALYHKQTKPLFDYWQKLGKLIKIEGEQSIEEVAKDIINKLNKKGIKM